MAKNGAVVSGIVPGSIAEDLGIEPGDRVLAINGHTINDILDYHFQADDLFLEIEVSKASGEAWVLEIEKDYEDKLGLEFDAVVFDRIRPCVNRCLFCFVDQLPPGMRQSLYVKDDDYRLSFLYGNYISLTNLTRKDWDKILGMRLSPLYVSVHATDPDTRARIFGSQKARSVMQDLKRLQEHGIEVHTQVVLCPGINDGEILRQTVKDLSSLWPSVQSIGIVPVGITGFRRDLPQLKTVTGEKARTIIQMVNRWQDQFRREIGLGLVYLADEFYITAGVEFPDPPYYDDYPQIENGIGLTTDFLDELQRLLSARKIIGTSEDEAVSLVCGCSAESMFRTIARLLKPWGIDLQIIPVSNQFFGGGVTVTGLLTGCDITKALGKQYEGKRVLLPLTVLRDGGAVLLDDVTVSQMAEATGARLEVVEPNPAALLDAILSRP